jgi:hypothetical protein
MPCLVSTRDAIEIALASFHTADGHGYLCGFLLCRIRDVETESGVMLISLDLLEGT